MRCLRSLELSCRARFSQVTLTIILHLYSQPISGLSYSIHLKQKQGRTFPGKNTAFSRVTLALLLNTSVCEILPFPCFSLTRPFTILPPAPLPCCMSFLAILGCCVPVWLFWHFSPVELFGFPYHNARWCFSVLSFCSSSVLSLCVMVLLLSPVVPLGCPSVSLMSFNLKPNLNSFSFPRSYFPFMTFSPITTIHKLNHACYLGHFLILHTEGSI